MRKLTDEKITASINWNIMSNIHGYQQPRRCDAPTAVPMLIYIHIHKELSLHISSSATLACINWIPTKYCPF